MDEAHWLTARASLPRPLTDSAGGVLNDVAEIARLRKLSGAVPPVVLLWGVLRRWDKRGRLGLVVLEKCSVDRPSLERAIEAALRASAVPPGPGPEFERVWQVVVQADAEAAAQGRDYVGTEHFVMALLRAGDGTLDGLFAGHHVTYERFQAKLAAFFSTGTA